MTLNYCEIYFRIVAVTSVSIINYSCVDYHFMSNVEVRLHLL